MRFATLHSLTNGSRTGVDATFRAMADRLAEADERATVQFRIGFGDNRDYWCLDLTSGGCEAKQSISDGPDLEIITQSETWRRIAEGELSPLDAFVNGRLRVRGDFELGQRLFRFLAAPGGQFTVC